MKYLFLSVVVTALSFLNFLRPLEEISGFILMNLSVPLRSLAVQTKDTLSFFSSINSIYKENQKLKSEIIDLQSHLVTLSDLQEENSVLKSQFLDNNHDSFDNEADRKLILANVLGNSQDATHSTIFINVGKASGVAEGDMIIYKNHLVGIVKKTKSRYSLVDLVFSPDLKVAVKVINSLEPTVQTEGLVSGDFGTSLKLERVLQKESLLIGDILITSGRDGLFEPGYLVGKVGEIYAEPTQPLKSAQVYPFIDIERLDKVFVLKQNPDIVNTNIPEVSSEVPNKEPSQ